MKSFYIACLFAASVSSAFAGGQYVMQDRMQKLAIDNHAAYYSPEDKNFKWGHVVVMEEPTPTMDEQTLVPPRKPQVK